MIQGTKPQTLAYSLTDLPGGLAAWIVEKFRTWNDCGGDVERRFSKDVLLTNVMLYWVTGAINSSFWPYWARRHETWPFSEQAPMRAPAGYASFPKEILHCRARGWGRFTRTSAAGPWCRRAATLRRWRSRRHSPWKSAPSSASSAERLSSHPLVDAQEHGVRSTKRRLQRQPIECRGPSFRGIHVGALKRAIAPTPRKPDRRCSSGRRRATR